MVFYTQNTVEGDIAAQNYQRPAADSNFDDPHSLIYNWIGSFTGMWDPLQPAPVNQARGSSKPKAHRRPRQPGALAPGLAARGAGDPFTPNPWGVSDYNFDQYNQGEMWAKFEGRRYLGGYADDYVSRTTVPVPYGEDNLSLRYFANKGKSRNVYGVPVYREGDESNYAARLTPDQIRQWQAFFQAQGFKTGPSGVWSSAEISAMRAFMTMANGVPGGGMTVDVLRQRVQNDIETGALRPGELAVSLGGDLNELGEMVSSGGTSGGEGADMMPYTETSTQTQIQEMSADQGLLILRDAWIRSLGRAPSDAELSRFVKSVNAAMRADPTIITTVATHDPMAGTTTTETTTEETSVDPQGMALRESEQPSEERTEYQTNRYLDALAGLVGL